MTKTPSGVIGAECPYPYVEVVKYTDTECGWTGFYVRAVGMDSIEVVTDTATGPWETEAEAEAEAAMHAHVNGLRLKLRDDPGGAWADMALQVVEEREERQDGVQAWMA